MKNMAIKILMVDDHPITLDGYKKILTSLNKSDSTYIIETASNCEEAYNKINKSIGDDNLYEIIFLDIGLPPAEKLRIFSGEDLGLKIREISPFSKIIILTMYNENFRIHNILKNISPEGLLIKSEVTPQEFFKAFNQVLDEKLYYSQTVNALMRKQYGNKVVLDELDRNILFHLSKGIMTKDIIEYVPLSLAAIEKRKKNMKIILNVEGGDLLLIDKARELGFI